MSSTYTFKQSENKYCAPYNQKMMQSLGRRYVQYFNFEHRRSGTLWESQFKSCLIQEKRYLLEVYRYIKLNLLSEQK